MYPPLRSVSREHPTFSCVGHYAHLPFSINKAWWAVLDAADRWKTRLNNEVACATCQCMPVPVLCGGILEYTSDETLPLRLERGHRFSFLPSSVNNEIPNRAEAMEEVSPPPLVRYERTYKLLVFPYHCLPPPFGMYGSASVLRQNAQRCILEREIPMMAIPSKEPDASSVGGFFASPTSCV